MVPGTPVVELKLLKTPLIVLPLVFLATMAISCTEEPVQPVVIQYDYSGELEFGGLVRTYDVHLPASYDGTSDFPLLLTFHGGGGRGGGMPILTHLNRIADREEFIVVYPDGYRRSWADGRGKNAAELAGVDDVGFISALIDELAGELEVVLSQVYAAGISNGGFLSQRLACELSDKIAAIAVVAATMPENLASGCSPQRPVSVIFIHGTEDSFVPWEGGEVPRGPGGRVLSVDDAVEKWVEINGCSLSPTVTQESDRVDDGTQVRCEAYGEGKDGTEVVLYIIEGGGHTWPGGWQYLPERTIGRICRDIDASEIIWDFLHKHRMNK